MKVLFVTATEHDEPLGPMYLASMINREGHEAEVVILDWDDIYKRVRFFQPDVIAYSIVTGEQKRCLSINIELRKQYAFFSVWGGAHTTFFPEFIENEGANAVCIGEGEFAFIELLDKLQHDQDIRFIRNFWVKHNGVVYRNECRPLIEDLDVVPFPERTLYRRYKVENDCNVITSRGCPYACSYCFNHRYNSLYQGKGKILRLRSMENVIQELEEVNYQYAPSIFKFHDDLFIASKKRVKEFCAEYRRRLSKPFTCSVKADILDEEITATLKSAGCRAVFIGIESGNEIVREKVLRRRMTNKQILDACTLLHKYGILIIAQNMVGIPGTTIKQDWQTLELNVACKPYLAWVSICTPYPKTDLAEMGKDAGLIPYEFVDELPETYHLRTMLRLPHARQVDNLHKLFSLGVEYPTLLPRIAQFLSNDDQNLFEEMRTVFAEFRRYKYHKLLNEQLELPETVRAFIATNL